MSELRRVSKEDYDQTIDRLDAEYGDPSTDIKTLKDTYESSPPSVSVSPVADRLRGVADRFDQRAQNKSAQREYALAESMAQDVRDQTKTKQKEEQDDAEASYDYNIAYTQGRERRDKEAMRREKIARGVGKVGLAFGALGTLADRFGNGLVSAGSKFGDKINSGTETLTESVENARKRREASRRDAETASWGRHAKRMMNDRDTPAKTRREKHQPAHRGAEKNQGRHRDVEKQQKTSRTQKGLGRLALSYHNVRGAISAGREAYDQLRDLSRIDRP